MTGLADISVTVTDGLGNGDILSSAMRNMVDITGSKESATVTVIRTVDGKPVTLTGEISGDRYQQDVVEQIEALVKLPRQPDASSTDVWGADASILLILSGQVVWANALQKNAPEGAAVPEEARQSFRRIVDTLLKAGLDAVKSKE
ncbi:hypothetical protein FBU59_005701 [Linderina macrospora]|uniref:Uncharacterized protein n=1 Tax=Linderina macrospora TaxID=4868 RepID=A0ACC1J286_9FUNG|nr:hypothetical protein FBU59_005701 [Linderina macrospora]